MLLIENFEGLHLFKNNGTLDKLSCGFSRLVTNCYRIRNKFIPENIHWLEWITFFQLMQGWFGEDGVKGLDVLENRAF